MQLEREVPWRAFRSSVRGTITGRSEWYTGIRSPIGGLVHRVGDRASPEGEAAQVNGAPLRARFEPMGQKLVHLACRSAADLGRGREDESQLLPDDTQKIRGPDDRAAGQGLVRHAGQAVDV